jgi:Protein of unknown function (DUF3093)
VVRYREKLRVPWLWWPAAALAVAFAGAEMWLGPYNGWVVAGILTVAFVIVISLIALGAARIEVGHGALSAARARLPIELTGQIRVLSKAEVRRAIGVGADARAFLVTRSWLPGGVLVEIVDEDDDTPYWLLSSRRPSALAAAIADERAAVTGADMPADDRP